MLERDVENHLVACVKKAGGMAPKFTSPGRRSVPDRMVLMPAESRARRDERFDRTVYHDIPARTVFVELKAPGKKATDAQLREHKRLRDMGFRVEVIDTKEGVDAFMLTV